MLEYIYLLIFLVNPGCVMSPRNPPNSLLRMAVRGCGKACGLIVNGVIRGLPKYTAMDVISKGYKAVFLRGARGDVMAKRPRRQIKTLFNSKKNLLVVTHSTAYHSQNSKFKTMNSINITKRLHFAIQ